MGLALAAPQGSIKIQNAVGDHTYTAYQIFAGDYANNKLSNITWGSGITEAGKSALYTKYELSGNDQNAQKVADTISGLSDAREVAETIGSNVTGGKTGSLSGTDYTISDLADGYYMIVDTYTGSSSENVVISRYMITKVGTATVQNKADKPTVEKKIVEDENRVVANTANIGDEVTYEITSAVPDMTGYKEYYMTFSDTLSKGLTYKADSLEVTIAGTKLTEYKTGDKKDAGYTKTIGTYSETAGTSITVNLFDLVSRKYTKGASIVITYKATVNDNAVIGNGGNPNTVNLQYSNNPQNSGDGTPDNGDDGVHGITPNKVVKTFVTELTLKKVEKGTLQQYSR